MSSNMKHLKHWGINVALYSGIIVATLVVIDLVTIALGLFPPTQEFGDPDVGWVAARGSGEMREDRCRDFAKGALIPIARNEDGLRTSWSAQQLRDDRETFRIAVTGDSQTELCAPNDQTHFGVMERELRAAGVKAAVFAYGGGKYSPLQAYLAVMRASKGYSPNALVLNFYTGNDFGDMFRIDDRPHFVPAGDGYDIAPPVWYQLDDPNAPRRSRVLFAISSIAKKIGIRRVLVRIRYLRATAAQQGRGFRTVLAYMNDLRKSVAPEVGYPAAFTAQMLNQQIFFHRFPGSREESVKRVRALLEMIHRDNPDMLLVLSPLPSYEVVAHPVNDVFLRTVERIPITYADGVREEGELYAKLGELAAETGWLFVNNLEVLRSYAGTDQMYNDFDYHLLPVASEIIGQNEASVMAPAIRSRLAESK